MGVLNVDDATYRALNRWSWSTAKHVLECPAEAIVKGDGRSLSIAAASIVAKVTRDRMMRELEEEYPGFGFAQHKGYGTAQHREALAELGPCPVHRRSFAPIRALLKNRVA